MDRPIMAYKFALIVYIMEIKNDLLTHSDTRYVRTLFRGANTHAYGMILAHLTCYSRNLKNPKYCIMFDQIGSITLGQHFIFVY